MACCTTELAFILPVVVVVDVFGFVIVGDDVDTLDEDDDDEDDDDELDVFEILCNGITLGFISGIICLVCVSFGYYHLYRTTGSRVFHFRAREK